MTHLKAGKQIAGVVSMQTHTVACKRGIHNNIHITSLSFLYQKINISHRPEIKNQGQMPVLANLADPQETRARFHKALLNIVDSILLYSILVE